jgi:hypothetical protein
VEGALIAEHGPMDRCVKERRDEWKRASVPMATGVAATAPTARGVPPIRPSGSASRRRRVAAEDR